MKAEYPNLTKMGVNNPEQIQSYSIARVERGKDILRIKYRRPAGSLLPVTRSYEFDRTPRATDPDATGGDLTAYEISPFLDVALLELESIVRAHEGRGSVLDDILNQIGDLEREFAGEIASLRKKLQRLQKLG